MEFILFPISFVFIVLCAALVRMMGAGVAYRLFFFLLALVIVLKTLRGS